MIRIRQIKVPLEKDSNEYLLNSIAKILKVDKNTLSNLKIVKKSIDARKKDNVFYVYEVDINVPNQDKILKKLHSLDIFETKDENYVFEITGEKTLFKRPVIVGSGPAGLFCAYILAEHNYKPLIIERGAEVDERVEKIEQFWQTGVLDINTNVQFGEGGAGTFSDGKLNTLVKDKAYRNKKVYDIFIENGAPEEIRYLNHPHIGTDILRTVIKNIRNKIISMGGEFHYHTCLTNIIVENNSIKAIEINNQKILECHNLILAIGHSARDTFEMLSKYDLSMQPKPFAIGIRIEHLQSLINKNQYGEKLSKILPPASYKLTYTTSKKRGVYSFCMCPGGFVVNASSEKGCLAINGMSNYKRDEKNANSAIVVTIFPEDFGNNPLDGLSFQRKLEHLAYQNAQGKIPVQLYKDFKQNKKSNAFLEITPCMKGNYSFGNLNEIFPSYVIEALQEAIPVFDKKIPGFADDGVILSAIESRTSSPIKIPRYENGQSKITGIFPCGEGSGYAGGITTAAMDGLKIAECFAKIYRPFKH